MSEVLGIFQIGPVQEFINCAKKTQDFWSGSYLLSYLTCVAIEKVVQGCGGDKNVIIYPSLNKQPIFEYIQKIRNNKEEPWGNIPSYKNNELRPTIPNRFVCKLEDSQACYILKEAEEMVNKTFIGFVNRTKLEIEKRINHFLRDKKFWDKIWSRQGKNFFEIYWIISPLTYDYQSSYKKAEVLFGARKGIRSFTQINEPGYKCTLCGQYEAINDHSGDSLKREKLRDFWDNIRKNTGYNFREGEHLCTICTTKRLMADYVFGYSTDFPSTGLFAVSDFIEDVIVEYPNNTKTFFDKRQNVLTEFINKARLVAKQEKLNLESEPIQKINNLSEKKMIPVVAEFSKLEGTWLLEDIYDNILSQKGNPKDILKNADDAKKRLQILVNKVKDIQRNQGITSYGPGKYYAVFQMDGDNIGKIISQKKSAYEHKQLSEKLCTFSTVEIPTIVEEKYLGKVIYFGGDEGIAFTSLKNILPIIEDCREIFRKEVKDTTASIGVVVAHHQQALLQVLSELKKVVNKVKLNLEGKDGFCISLMKRSGGVTYGLGHWQYNDIKVVPLLEDLIRIYQKNIISTRWYYQFATEKLGLVITVAGGSGSQINLDLALSEMRRLFHRHADKKKINNNELNQLLDKLEKLMIEINNWDEFMGLMGVAVYISRGGEN